ncbi:hypothetical protein CSPX01_16266 [Colletotrichum filicis]|nr:hypothetical protein CSPX01_16266 [Colletotrichum filicis]
MSRCKCGFLISHKAISTHVCGLVSDAAWLGTVEDVPDTSVPLLKWYQDHNLGFGGVPLPNTTRSSSPPPTHAGQRPLRTLPADGIRITDEVIARHYSSFNSLIGDARAFEDFPSKIADIQDLVRKFHQRSEAFLRYCKRRAESPEEEESSEIIDEEGLGDGFYTGDLDSGEDSEDDLDMDSAGIQHILDNFGDADSRLRSDFPHIKWFLRPRNYHAETKDLIRKFRAEVKVVARLYNGRASRLTSLFSLEPVPASNGDTLSIRAHGA